MEKTPLNPIKSIELQIDSLKAQLIGLTQQRDRLSGNPVAERMVVTVDVLPSTFNQRRKEKMACDLRCDCGYGKWKGQ